jgi:hypothetical protein
MNGSSRASSSATDDSMLSNWRNASGAVQVWMLSAENARVSDDVIAAIGGADSYAGIGTLMEECVNSTERVTEIPV